MKIVNKMLGTLGYKVTKKRSGYSGAKLSRLVGDWVKNIGSANKEIYGSLNSLRSHSRELAMNNDYAKKYFNMVVSNIIGIKGVKLQARAKDTNSALDKGANEKIEAAWKAWGKPGFCTVCGMYSWNALEKLVLQSVARDGEILIRIVRGFKNPFRFSLQVIEADHLDEDLNQAATSGKNRISMGVEYDKWGKPIYYHILTKHPGDNSFAGLEKRHDRLPAKDIIHLFHPDRVGQSRGIPWMHTAMNRLKMLSGYEEAALVEARVASCKMGFFTANDDYEGDDEDVNGNTLSDAEPGTFEQLPKGMDVSTYDPNSPNGNFPFFVKAILRGISSGLGVAYNAFASDLEGVNFSSIRAGVLEERDQWRVLQGWLAENLHQKVYEAWLDMALLTKKLPLSVYKYDKYLAVEWQGRGWAWVDPLKDIAATEKGIKIGVTTRKKVLAEHGLDVEEVFEQLAEEEKLAKAAGLNMNAENKPNKEVMQNNAGASGKADKNQKA